MDGDLLSLEASSEKQFLLGMIAKFETIRNYSQDARHHQDDITFLGSGIPTWAFISATGIAAGRSKV